MVCHLIFGECWNSNAALCTDLMNSTPFILDAMINLGCKKTLWHVLDCVGIPHTSTDPICTLWSLLVQHCETSPANGRLNLQCARDLKSEDSTTTLNDVANAWPQWIPHADKACIVHEFHAVTSLNMLKTVTCATCAEKVHVTDMSNQFVSDVDFNILHGHPFQPDWCGSTLTIHRRSLAGILVDSTSVCEDSALSLLLCFPCRNTLSRGKLPNVQLWQHNHPAPVTR